MVVSLYKDHSISQISGIVGLGKWSVRDVLLKHHVPMRQRGGSASLFRYAYDHKKWRRVVMYLYWDLEMNLDEVAKRCNINRSTLLRRMKKHGIARRSPGQARLGRKRGKYNYRPDLPACETDGCNSKVAIVGKKNCARCRRRLGLD
jgi:hypothetical protein